MKKSLLIITTILMLSNVNACELVDHLDQRYVETQVALITKKPSTGIVPIHFHASETGDGKYRGELTYESADGSLTRVIKDIELKVE